MRVIKIEEYEDLIQGHYNQIIHLNDVLEIVKINNALLSELGSEKFFFNEETQISYVCFLTTSFLDLLTTLKGFLISNTEWESIYFSKKGFLIIYETIKTYNTHQKNIKSLLDKNYSELILPYFKINDILKNFKVDYKYETKINNIRNKTAGHFDKDFSIFYGFIKTLNEKESIEMIENFLDISKLIMNFIFIMAEEVQMTKEEKIKHRETNYLIRIENINRLIDTLK